MSKGKVASFRSGSPDPEVAAEAQGREFNAEDRKRILEETDRAVNVGPILKREGIYYSVLLAWRKERDAAVHAPLLQERGQPAALWSHEALWQKARLHIRRGLKEERDGPMFALWAALALA